MTTAFSRSIGELLKTGIIYTVSKRTGQISTLSVRDYAAAEKCNLLDGFFVRLGSVAAESLSAEIQNAKLRRN